MIIHRGSRGRDDQPASDDEAGDAPVGIALRLAAADADLKDVARQEDEGRRTQVRDPPRQELCHVEARPGWYMNVASVKSRPAFELAEAWSMVISTITSPRSQSSGSCRLTAAGATTDGAGGATAIG
jgi:hypothetical protein